MSTGILLEVNDLHVEFEVYGGILRVLDGVNFRVNVGEKVGLVGETGCGKTTTMKAVQRILPMPPGRKLTEVAKTAPSAKQWRFQNNTRMTWTRF